MSPKDKQIHVYVSPELHEFIKQLAGHKSMSQYLLERSGIYEEYERYRYNFEHPDNPKPPVPMDTEFQRKRIQF